MGDITRAELAQLGLRAAALTNIPTADQDVEIETTSSLCRAYVRKRYTDPAQLAAAVVDPAYKGAVAKICTHRLLTTYGYEPSEGPDVAAVSNHDAMLTFLRDVSKNIADLNVPTTVADGFAAVLDDDGGISVLSDERRD